MTARRNGNALFFAATTAASALTALLVYRAGFSGLRFDAYHFYELARIVSTEGLLGLSSRVRTWGYPFFVAVCQGLTDRGPSTARTLVFAAQLLIYLAVCLYAARVAARVFLSDRFSRWTYAVLAVNPLALIRTTEMLSDLLAAVLLLLSLLFSIERSRPVSRAAAAFLALGLAVAVRPASLAALPALLLLWLLRRRVWRDVQAGAWLLAAVCVAVPMLPQLQGNVAAWDEWKPLTLEPIYRDQTHWGLGMLKYGTLVTPDAADPRLVYRNPLYPEGAASPREFLTLRPLGYLATLALHGFAMFDQDHPFTYITDPSPWYRWPLAFGNSAFLFLAILGLASGWRRTWRDQSPQTLYFVGAAAVGLSIAALYLPVAVECRFSFPIYLLWTPAAVYAALGLTRERLAATCGAFLLFFAASVALSLWISAQATG